MTIEQQIEWIEGLIKVSAVGSKVHEYGKEILMSLNKLKNISKN